MQRSLRQYSCQNHSLGDELEAAGYPALAKDKYELSAKEVLICEKLSVLLRLGRSESLSPDSPEFIALHSLLSAEIVVTEISSRQQPHNLDQRDEIRPQMRPSEGEDDLPLKRRRCTDVSHPPEASPGSPSRESHEPVYTHTATEGDWNLHTPERESLHSSSLLAQKSPPLNSSFHENDEEIPLNISDHTIVGSLSQEVQNGNGNFHDPKSNELNLSAISNSSSALGSSLVHSTPSPEVITQHRNGLRRYHSEEGGGRRSLGGPEVVAAIERSSEFPLRHCGPLLENSFQSEQAKDSLSKQRSITQ